MQIILNGLISGCAIALLGMGFNAVFLPARVFHIAAAGIYSITPFLVWSLWKTSWHPAWGITIALLSAAGLSILCELVNHWPLARKKASEGLHLISSLGISIVLVQITVMIWGNESRILRSGIDNAVVFSGIRLTHSQLITGGVSLLFIIFFALWLTKSKKGLEFRALSDNPFQLMSLGYNIRRLRLLAFGLSGLLVGASSILTAYDVGFDPHGGLHALILGVVAVIVGGRGSWFGPVLAGIALGIIRALIVWQFSARWQDAAVFLILVLVLLIFPQGLLGRRNRLEASF